MTEQNKLQPAELKDQLADLTETMQRENINFSPEMQKYFDGTLAVLTDKMAKGEMPTRNELDEFIGKIKEWIENEKFIQIDMSKSYDEMADTLDNYGYIDKRPDKVSVLKAIRDLGPEMLERIRKFKRPTILITPAGDLASKIQKLDANKKYKNKSGKQENTYFNKSVNDYLWGSAPTKLTVTIVDGAPEMQQLPADKVKLNNEQKHTYLAKEYNKLGMRMITAQEYAMLAQKSLRSYEQTKNPDEIIDQQTITILNADHLTDLNQVLCVYWLSSFRLFRFDWGRPDAQDGTFRGRPSVQVL